jgi:uncharacterized protein (DUF2267 family)
MSLDFEKYAAKGNEFVNLVAEELQQPRDKAGRVVRAVFHALRNRLTHEESFQLMAQLPVALKGVYVDGWKFNKGFNRIRHLNDFLDEVRREDGGLAGFDFGNDSMAEMTVASVFKVLSYFVSEEEMNDVRAVMPAELKEFIKESIAGKNV